ncbi:NADP-dependent 3-hydroxy acid dehydrogenase YdfG [Pedobacter psychrotolerans]|uniref:NADP-dependent 3-hydroxy acid dehydrogenase YdfG n=1 Tax=Pedobacter psychrotolerans TaxID=1843235 RepID=A0A4R2HQK5_9SPHI|nr:SDR family oxidoreductase [Pedobacter psychrotolerans]TCO31111.1 NADP-dependent 3-hydroxy acid dehydrogenase YdfG [Pedobacter psychrotolerans]GGE42142.1 oxidoreductase [Pedobacter psychrotolerans]
MQNIKGKVVAITGASSGMGKAIAIELAKNGAKVVLGARRTEPLEQIVKEIKSTGGEATCAQIDVKNKADLVRLVNITVELYGKLDVIVNNAGVSQLSRIDELDIDGWEEMIDINLKGVLYGMAAAIPIFKKQQSGHIVNIISTSGIKIAPMQGVYAGTKNAIRTIAEAFRQESDGKIRITGISPGFVKTDFADNIKNEEMKTAIKQGMEQIAINPIAIANAVIYAVSQPEDVEIGDIVIRPSKQN